MEAVELAAAAGLVLDEWQQFALMAALRERRRKTPGRRKTTLAWSAFEVALVVARQNGKGSILEARELAGLFLFGEQLILHSAHEFKTAQEAFRRVLSLVENTDDLRKRVARIRTSHGEEGIELIGGQRLRFVARSTGSGRGFTGDCVILDEAYRLPPEAMGALLPTLSARPNPQLWYTSSAGHSDSEVLRSVRDRGVKGDAAGLCYLEWSAEPDADPADPQAWAAANPAMGIRISEEHIALELSAMPDAEFARERLGIWEGAHGVDMALALDAWMTCADDESAVGDPVAFAVDVSPEGSTSIAVAGGRSDDLLHVEVIDSRPGTAWVPGRLAELSARWNPVATVLDAGSPAGALIPDLERDGITFTKVAGREVAQSAVAFRQLVDELRLRHRNQSGLNAAVASARRRNVGDLWAFGRRGSFTDISPLVACSLAAWGYAQSAHRGPQIIDLWEDE